LAEATKRPGSAIERIALLFRYLWSFSSAASFQPPPTSMPTILKVADVAISAFARVSPVNIVLHPRHVAEYGSVCPALPDGMFQQLFHMDTALPDTFHPGLLR